MRFILAACVSALAALASAYTPANTAQAPSGNPIGHPMLGEMIPAGQTYTITWTPDIGDRVTILLLRGPSTNVVPILTIAESIPNTGAYIWAFVPTSLQPDSAGYGIQLIVEGTGQYQYSPQCGVQNHAYSGSSSPSASSYSYSSSPVLYSAPSYSYSSSPVLYSATNSIVTVISTSNITSPSTSSSPVMTTPTHNITYSTTSSTSGTGHFNTPLLTPSKSSNMTSLLQSSFAQIPTRGSGSTPTAAGTNLVTTGAARRLAQGAGVVMAVAGAAAAFAL